MLVLKRNKHHNTNDVKDTSPKAMAGKKKCWPSRKNILNFIIGKEQNSFSDQ